MADEKEVICLPTPPTQAVCHNATSPTGFVTDEKVVADSKEKRFSEMTASTMASTIITDLEAQGPEPKRRPFARVRYIIMTVYRRLFSIVFLANLACFIYVLVSDRQLLALVDATAVNLVACGLARHPMVVNLIYRVICSVPRSAPLWIRRRAANAAHYGGVHSGCGVASLLWYIGFVGVVSDLYWNNKPISDKSGWTFSAAPVTIAYILLVLLFVMIVVAYPTIRRKFHDYFELTHRFNSWLILALFVVLLMIFVHEVSRAQLESFGHFLITLPAFWLLVAAVVAVAHPWLLLRKIPVQAERLSPHAVRLHFTHTPISFAKGIQVSKHPLRDWHSFAGFPDPDASGKNNAQGNFSVVVSKAGDWTADTIKNPPTHLWKRGALMRGVGYGMRVFSRILIVTTGSGIGPCLGFLGDENRPLIKVIWQTRTPMRTYGKDVLELVHRMGPDPIILDTNASGRVDMRPIIRQQVKEFQAEAVFVISNPAMTQSIVYEFESQGIPAYGPIFDS